MKHLIQYWWSIKRMLFCVAAVVPALSWGFGAQAYHLVDDATGKALVTLPSGEPEAFFAVGGRLLFVGHNTNTRVEQDDPPKGYKFPWVDIGSRFKLRDENRWVRVEAWCCDEYNWVKQKSTPAWGAYYHSLYKSRVYDRFGDQLVHEFAGSPEATDCVPFTNMPTFVIDPKTQKPKWTKYFAVARQGWDPSHRECGRETWNINASADVGSSLDSKSVLVTADDTGSAIAYLRVSIETGEILEPIPSDHKAIDFEDVERFKAAFLHVNQCPAFTSEELARKDRYQKTSTGRCMIQRRIRYEESIMRHFMGEPKPPLQN